MEQLEKKTYYNILFSYYKALLTLKKQQIFSYYYEQDYSITEISEELNVSRNAIFDTLKKVTNELDQYEKLLALYEKDQKREKIYQKYASDTTLALINELKEME